MANFATADLIKYQAKITQMFQSGELRFRMPAVFNFLRRSTEIMIPSHKEIKYSAKRTTGEVNYMQRTSRSLGTGGEAFNHTGAKGDSGVLVPAWTPYDDKFYYSVKQANSSVWSLDEELMNEMTNLNINFSEGVEEVGASFLHDNRSGVNTYSRQGSFNGVNDVFEIDEDLTSVTSTGYRVVQIIKSAMEVNKWKGMPLSVICDTVFFDKMEALANQGSGNQNNLTFQFSGVEFIKSVELDAKATALGYTRGYCVVVPMGMVSLLDWIPEQNRNGLETKENKYGTIIHPSTGLSLATHEYMERADQSGSGGENQDVKVETQAFVYLSPNYAPLSTTDETPIQAFALVEFIQA